MSKNRYSLRSRSYDESRGIDETSNSEGSQLSEDEESVLSHVSVVELFDATTELDSAEEEETFYETMAKYHDFSGSLAERMSYVTWYNVKDLVSAVRSMQRINFSVVEKRAQALDTLNNVSDDVPYGEDKQFPEKGLYICAGKGDWGRKIQQLRTSLSFKENPKDPRPSTSTGTDANDASLAFYNACTAIMTQVAQGDYIYTRKKFEEEFGLKWQTQVN